MIFNNLLNNISLSNSDFQYFSSNNKKKSSIFSNKKISELKEQSKIEEESEYSYYFPKKILCYTNKFEIEEYAGKVIRKSNSFIDLSKIKNQIHRKSNSCILFWNEGLDYYLYSNNSKFFNLKAKNNHETEMEIETEENSLIKSTYKENFINKKRKINNESNNLYKNYRQSFTTPQTNHNKGFNFSTLNSFDSMSKYYKFDDNEIKENSTYSLKLIEKLGNKKNFSCFKCEKYLDQINYILKTVKNKNIDNLEKIKNNYLTALFSENSANISRIYDVWINGYELNILREYFPISLYELKEHIQFFSESLIRTIFKDVFFGLMQLKKLGLKHGNLSLENIHYSYSNIFKIADFQIHKNQDINTENNKYIILEEQIDDDFYQLGLLILVLMTRKEITSKSLTNLKEVTRKMMNNVNYSNSLKNLIYQLTQKSTLYRLSINEILKFFSDFKEIKRIKYFDSILETQKRFKSYSKFQKHKRNNSSYY